VSFSSLAGNQATLPCIATKRQRMSSSFLPFVINEKSAIPTRSMRLNAGVGNENYISQETHRVSEQ